MQNIGKMMMNDIHAIIYRFFISASLTCLTARRCNTAGCLGVCLLLTFRTCPTVAAS
jgi:hypothetical protein